MKNLLRDVKISTRVFALVGLTALLMALVIGLGLRQINAIGKEVATITEENIPLLRVLNRITFHNIKQDFHLERAIRLGKRMTQDKTAKDNFEMERNNVLRHGQKITQEIEDGRKLVEQMCENYNTSGTEDMLLSIDYALRSISKERADFQFLAERVFNLLSQDKLEQAESAIQKIVRGYKTEEEEEIRHEELLENLSSGIEKFVGYSVVEARRSKQNAVVGMLSYSVLVLLFSLALGIFISRTVTKPLSIAVNVAHQIAAGDRNVEIKAISKDETGRLLAAMKKMSCAIEKSEENLKAANQQLQASEQQLKAANQQLDASNQQLQASEQHLKATNQQLRANEEQLRALNHHLNERSKELDCLYRVSRLATEVEKSMDDIFTETVDLIPSSWQYPEITCARIAVNGQEFMTDNFEETKWKQSADIVVSEGKIGSVEVYYLQDKPVIDEGPFLKEERHLIDAMGRQLGIIFERKQAEEELKAERNKLQATMAAIEGGVTIQDREYNIIYQNRFLEERFGGLGEKCYRVYEGKEEICEGCPAEKAFRDGKCHTAERKVVMPNGEIRYWDNAANPIRDAAGEVVSCVELARDITERKQAGDELKSIKKQIEFILGATNTGIDIIDSEFNIRYIDPEWQKAYGDPTGRKCYEYFMDRTEICPGCGIVKALKTKKIAVTEEVLVKENNKPIQVTTVPFQDENGEWLVAEVNTDIGERKKAEKKLKQLNYELEEVVEKLGRANSELKDFVYIASHDLREPMRKISSFGELLSASLKDKLGDDDKENLGFMVDGATRMQQMIDALLTYSRITTRSVDFEPVDLNKVAEELCTVELAVKIEEIGAKIMTPEQLHNVNCDPAQIRQLMQNLVANGLKYQKEDVAPEITIRSSVADNGMVRVEVADNGIGIKEEHFKNVFVMFKRLHSRQEYEGTGIGLAVCKKIVERHGGDIGVSSTYGEGTTFWFTMPVSRTPEKRQMELVSSSKAGFEGQ